MKNIPLWCVPLLAGTLPCAALAEPDVERVVVTGQRTAYRNLAVAGATKTDTLPLDLPQSARTLGADLLRDAGVVSLSDALDLASGIARQSNFGGLWDSYAMRGFTGDPNFGSDYMVNGFNASRGYNGMRDIAGTQAVEILKGPASALYGRGEPGGTVNILTKKPRFAPQAGVEAALASHRVRRVAADLTGPLSDRVAYRLNLAHQEGGSFRDRVHGGHAYAAPSLVWLAGPDTTVSYEIEAMRQRTPFDRGIPVVPGQARDVPVGRFLGEPADGPVTIRSLGHQLFVQHALADGWSLQGGASYRASALAGYSSEAYDLLADGRTLRRQRRQRDFAATDRSLRLELVGTLRLAGIEHGLLAGTDAYRFDDTRLQRRRNPSAAAPYAIDLFAPAYGGTAAPLATAIDTVERQRAASVYVQDQLAFGPRFKALVGVRRDRYRQTVDNRRTAAVNRQALGATSPRIGLVWQPNAVTALYASTARGFRPNSGIGSDNRAFPAETSRAHELGAKIETPGGLSGTLALYRIDKANVLTTDPAHPDYAIAAGAAASRGLEFDLAGQLRPGLKLSAAYAYTDARVTRGDGTIRTGSRFPNVARHSANLLLMAGDARLSAGAGLAYVGARRGDVAVSSDFELSAYTTARLLAAYAPNRRWRIALNVDNLFDRRYYASSYSRYWVAPGAPRSFGATLSYRY